MCLVRMKYIPKSLSDCLLQTFYKEMSNHTLFILLLLLLFEIA